MKTQIKNLLVAILLLLTLRPVVVSAYYDPELGRFIQPDTVIPDLGNPQSYNRYSYVLNNPLRYTDPSGHEPGDLFTDQPMMTPEAAVAFSKAAAPMMVGGAVAVVTGGAAAPVLAGYASPAFVAIGSGIIGGVAGDAASQGTQMALGQRQSFSGQEMAVSGLAGGALSGGAYGVSKLVSVNGVPKVVAEPTAPSNQLPVKYNPDFATLQRNGQLVPSVTPEGRIVTDHAANRILNGGPGRQPMSITDVDKVLNEGNVIKKVNVSNPKGPTVTVQNTQMPGKPQVTVDAETGKRVVTVIQPKTSE